MHDAVHYNLNQTWGVYCKESSILQQRYISIQGESQHDVQKRNRKQM